MKEMAKQNPTFLLLGYIAFTRLIAMLTTYFLVLPCILSDNYITFATNSLRYHEAMKQIDLNNEIVIYQSEDGKTQLDVKLEGETVWLNRQQLAELFDRDVKTIGKHINNALKEELNDGIPTVAKFATGQKEGTRNVNREIEYYNLDMIISVGYRVKSRRGVEFRRWANSVLKQYLIKGYAVNRHDSNTLSTSSCILPSLAAGSESAMRR